MSVQYPLKGIHIITGDADEQGPLPSAIIELERTNGEYIRQVDPVTRKAKAAAQRFQVQPDRSLRPVRG